MKYYEAILYGKLDTVLSPFARQQMKNRGSYLVQLLVVMSLTPLIAGTSLQNTLVHLRKCCNHPYLFHDWPLDSRGEEIVDESLVAASGKLLMLDRYRAKLLLPHSPLDKGFCRD
jgi:SNF2 family DNA or RNA helicase